MISEYATDPWAHASFATGPPSNMEQNRVEDPVSDIWDPDPTVKKNKGFDPLKCILIKPIKITVFFSSVDI